MKEQTKKSLLAKAERIAEESGDTMLATMFLNGADWYRNSVWHPASEKPAGVDDAGRDIHIVTMGPEYYGNKLQTWHIFSYMSWEWVKLHAGEFDKWAYLEDLLPDENA